MEEHVDLARAGVTIVPDLPDFVSPIDGTIVRGRAGMREHCKIHDVVPTADLKGLPTKHAVSEWKHTPREREEIRQAIAREIDGRRNR